MKLYGMICATLVVPLILIILAMFCVIMRLAGFVLRHLLHASIVRTEVLWQAEHVDLA